MDNNFIIYKLQEIGLKVTQANLKLNRWTDVKHVDGHTYGYIVNTTKNICNWLRRGTDEKGYFFLSDKPQPLFNLSNKDFRKQLFAEEVKTKKAYFDKATDLAKYYFELTDFASSSPYLDKKHVAKYNCKIDKNMDVIIPLRILLRDIEGNTRSFIKTIQTIKPNGTKLLAKGGQKKGAMSFINFKASLLPAPKNKSKMDDFSSYIVIAEGYATAATIAKLTGYMCVMAVDAGNLLEVTRQIKLSYPKAKIVIAADNDLKLKETQKDSGKWLWSNTGVEAAISCQNEVDCQIVIPFFDGLDPAKNLTDWNDLMFTFGSVNASKQFTSRVLK